MPCARQYVLHVERLPVQLDDQKGTVGRKSVRMSAGLASSFVTPPMTARIEDWTSKLWFGGAAELSRA